MSWTAERFYGDGSGCKGGDECSPLFAEPKYEYLPRRRVYLDVVTTAETWHSILTNNQAGKCSRDLGSRAYRIRGMIGAVCKLGTMIDK